MAAQLRSIAGVLQSALRMVLPAQCISCGGMVDQEFGLCPACWRDTPFISGLVCDSCGVPLPGDDDGKPAHCDDCITIARPWSRGRAAMVYRDNGRRLVLALKHGDRQDLVRPAAGWLHRAALPILRTDMLIAPIPLHRLRFLRRRYNQSALLARALGVVAGLPSCPDLLVRTRRTPSQEGKTRDARFENMAQAIGVHPKRRALLAGRTVLLIDDVMTSGATLAAAADALRAAGADDVCVLVLAHVAKDV